MGKKIIDCFSFYNEFDMLKFRLKYLYDYVDYFVLVEATHTYAGNPKELYYQNNKHLFEPYNDKIIHIIAELTNKEQEANAWVRENGQRNFINYGIDKIKDELTDDDLICISDLDEIPDRNMLNSLKSMEIKNDFVYNFNVKLYYYNLNCRSKGICIYPRMTNYYTYINKFDRKPNSIRRYGDDNYKITIEQGGWHLSYFGDIEFIKNKIREFAHQEHNNQHYLNDEKIMHQIKTQGDLYFRSGGESDFEYVAFENNNYLPENYEELIKFSDLYKS